MMELVLNRAHLIEEPEMPACLLDLCAHVNGYQAILKEWETGEISIEREDNISVVNFPGQELAGYAAAAFARLKCRAGRASGIDREDRQIVEANVTRLDCPRHRRCLFAQDLRRVWSAQQIGIDPRVMA